MAWSVFALTLVLGVSCGRPPVTNRAKLERQEAVERHQARGEEGGVRGVVKAAEWSASS